MKLYRIGDFAKTIGVTLQTLRNWDKLGKLKPHCKRANKAKKMLKELMENDSCEKS